MKTIIEEKIEEHFGEIIYKFPVLHHNWECDGYGYVVEKNGKKDIVMTNHGNLYVSSVKELYVKLAEYTKISFDTKKAITLLDNFND